MACFKFQNKVLGSVLSDYLQQAYSRRLKIVGEKGTLEWDFKENIVWLKTRKAIKNLFEVKNYDKNNMYIEELKYFFQCLKNKQPAFNTINQAAVVLNEILKHKK